ncbi:MAG TPA: protein translocase subunit SecF [Pyrinomonadaceae bacterium]|jgi:preprotein translocase subunit SecF|nr:protein translocase subunit SecF [Pyrinomonadaceae bacterium]
MIQFFKDVKIDWLANRRIFIAISVLLMVAGLSSAVFRHWKHPNGTEAFNLGVDFKGGTVITAKFKQRPSPEAIRDALAKVGGSDAIIQPVTDKLDTVLIKVPLESAAAGPEAQAQVDPGGTIVRKGLNAFGEQAKPEDDLGPNSTAAYKIVATDAVGAVAGAQLRNKAIAVTLAALVGILIYIAFRFEWTYGAAAVIAVFHDVLVTLGFFSIFQWEVSLTVIAALLTLVGFSVNDTIVVFDRIRENRRLHRRDSLYKITNDSINQTLSRTVITSGLVFLSVLAMVLFGGEVLHGFSLALLIGISFGTYSSIAIASPIMVWWEQRLDVANRAAATATSRSDLRAPRVSGPPKREPLTGGTGQRTKGAGRA